MSVCVSCLNNCLVWCVAQKAKYGGRIKWVKSRTWFGFHTLWIDTTGQAWEYTLAKPKKQPWWYIPILYRGVVKRVDR